MPIFGDKHRFTRNNVDLAPNQPGVYALYVDSEVAYYGCTRDRETIRGRLHDHLLSRQEPGRSTIKLFAYEITRFPLARECALLEEHRRMTWRLPRFNQPPRPAPGLGAAPAALQPS